MKRPLRPELHAGQREAREVEAAVTDEEETLAHLAERAEGGAANEKRLQHQGEGQGQDRELVVSQFESPSRMSQRRAEW